MHGAKRLDQQTAPLKMSFGRLSPTEEHLAVSRCGTEFSQERLATGVNVRVPGSFGCRMPVAGCFALRALQEPTQSGREVADH
jgi:hypothetical protein